jgi:hypothetical protein
MMAVRDIADRTPFVAPTGDEQVHARMAQHLCSVLESPYGAARLTDEMKVNLATAVKRASPEEVYYLAVGINHAVKGQRQLDREDNILLSRILATRGTSPLVQVIAQQAQQFAHSGVMPLNLEAGRNTPRFVL